MSTNSAPAARRNAGVPVVFFDTTLVFSAVTPGILRFSVLLSLGLGLGAGSLAAWRLVRTRPLVLWGRE